MNTIGAARWKIELRAATYPVEEWVEMKHWTGRRYRYVDQFEAEAEMDKLKAIQPHSVMRIVSIG